MAQAIEVRNGNSRMSRQGEETIAQEFRALSRSLTVEQNSLQLGMLFERYRIATNGTEGCARSFPSTGIEQRESKESGFPARDRLHW